ncbi:FG-GAP-like repeat-containing protein [Streptomyces gamaensis]|uniref:FG-GAP-like repeat-containing protein n=1 Tax=Streptomyces gamaensis TaxID=1763542 RepID=A0ABW0YZB6_9ACTN
MSRKGSRTAWATGLLATAVGAVALTGTPAAAVVGDEVKDGGYAFSAKLDIDGGTRGCSGVLVDQSWVLTAASCFAGSDGKVTPGLLKQRTTVSVGSDLTRADAAVTNAIELVPREDRDLVMVRLAAPVKGVTPVTLTSSAPAQGDVLKVAGFGRTKDEWVPDRPHTAEFTVDAVTDTSVSLSGKSADAAVCKGDTGGPAVRERNGRVELAAVNSTSWQNGCLGQDGPQTHKGAVDTRVDDLSGWVDQVRNQPQQFTTVTGDFDGDGKADLAALYDYGKAPEGGNRAALWVFTGKGDGTFSAPRVVWRSTGSWTLANSKLVAGDFNGDGKSDLAVLYNYGVENGRNTTGLWTFTSNGSGFDEPSLVWKSKDGWNWNSSTIAAGDFNGDGKADLAVLYNYGVEDGRNTSGLWTFTSNGGGFDAPSLVWRSKDGWNWNSSKLVAGDFNGDGKSDLAILYNYGVENGRNTSGLWTFTSNGGGFDAPSLVWRSKDGWNWNSSKLVAGDFNGDGKADVAVLYDYGVQDGRNTTGLWTFTSNGSGFDAPSLVWKSPSSWTWSRSTFLAGDLTGDGKADLAVPYEYGKYASGRNATGIWTFTSKGTGFNTPAKVWENKVPGDDNSPA